MFSKEVFWPRRHRAIRPLPAPPGPRCARTVRRYRLGGDVDEVADEITRPLVSLFLPGPDGRRPVHGDYPLLQEESCVARSLWFHEYFHGDTGAGLRASHQTGWTGLVLHLIAA